MIAAISPEIRFVQVTTMAERYDKLLEPWRLGATMFVVFGLLALVVAIVGLYAILAFAVAQRRRELVIRTALGAHGKDLIWLVMRQAGAFVIAGLPDRHGPRGRRRTIRRRAALRRAGPRSDRLRRRDARPRRRGARREPRPRVARGRRQSRVGAPGGIAGKAE